MDEKELLQTVQKAQMGDSEASMKLVELVMPLIAKYSIVNGHVDQDLRQHLIAHVLDKIKEFRF